MRMAGEHQVPAVISQQFPSFGVVAQDDGWHGRVFLQFARAHAPVREKVTLPQVSQPHQFEFHVSQPGDGDEGGGIPEQREAPFLQDAFHIVRKGHVMVAQTCVGRGDGGEAFHLGDVVACMSDPQKIRVQISQKHDHVRSGLFRHCCRFFQQGQIGVDIRQYQDTKAGKAGYTSGRGRVFIEFQMIGFPVHVGGQQGPQQNDSRGRIQELAELGTLFGERVGGHDREGLRMASSGRVNNPLRRTSLPSR